MRYNMACYKAYILVQAVEFNEGQSQSAEILKTRTRCCVSQVLRTWYLGARWGGEKEPSSLCGGGKDAILLVACVRTHFGF